MMSQYKSDNERYIHLGNCGSNNCCNETLHHVEHNLVRIKIKQVVEEETSANCSDNPRSCVAHERVNWSE